MNRLLSIAFVLFLGLVSCKKTTVTPPISPYNGQWLWIGSSSGFFTIDPSTDSAVVLSLDSDNYYQVTVAGQLSLQGTFTTDSSSDGSMIKFNNINQPAGDTASGTSGNTTSLYFNYILVGRLVIFQYNGISVSGDTLTIARYPFTPETPVSRFVRLTGGGH
jgi:hypothetical protein